MARRINRKPKRKLSTAAWFGIGCGGVLVLGLIALGFIYFMLTAEPPPPPEATADASAEAGERRTDRAAPPLEQQIQAVEQAGRSNQPVPVTMTVRESELNEMLAREGSGRVRDLQVYLGNGSIAATGETDYHGRRVHLTIRATPVIRDGELQVDVNEVLVGRMHAPESIKQEIRAEIGRSLQQTMRKRNIQVQGVQVQPDVLTVSGWVGGR